MSLLRLTKPIIHAIWAAVVLVGVLAGWVGYRSARTKILNDLMDDAGRCAAAFNPENVRRLAGSRDDLATANYAEIKRRLIRLQAATTRVKFVYLFRFIPETGKVMFLGDSAKPEAKDESLPGDDYPQAAQSPGLQAVIRSGLPATEGPLGDDFGTWVTGYAQVAETPSGKPDQLRKEILGLDLDAADWQRELWSEAIGRAFIVWMLLGVPFAAMLSVRRQLEQRGAIRNLSEAMEQSHSALMIVDLDSIIEYANRGLVHQIGYSRRELIGRNWRDFQVADTPPERLAEMVLTVRSGHSWEGEWFNRRKDGTVYPVRGVITPVKDRDGRLSSFVAVFDDMSDIKQQAAELRDARDHAQAGDRAKGQFLATMSHEVRTPLNGIIGFTNLLRNTPLTDEQRDYVDTIRAGGEALMQLTGDILDFSRIETGKLKLELAPCDPRTCIEEALDLLAEIANAKKLTLLHWVEDDVPASILADSGRLRQVLVNLLSNAVKFTEAGEVEVTVAVARPEPSAKTPLPAGHCLLRVSVRDTGMGIAVAEGSKLFKPFTQLDSSSTRKHGGTGLGLAISRDLVRLMGGDIVLASEPGHGSTFTFTMPAQIAEPAPTEPKLDGMRLLLVSPVNSLQHELVRLAARWRAVVLEADSIAGLPAEPWDFALVAIDEAQARVLAAQAKITPGLPPAKTFALAPVTLGTDVRTALRHHFRLIINCPPRHGALLELLRDLRPAAPLAVSEPTRYDLRVLVVEDNPVNQRLVLKMLANAGCTGHVVANGREAVDELSLRAAAYDLVLLDLHMPELDGIGALTEIRAGRAGSPARGIWITALTADARDEQKARAAAAGINDYLVKPLLLPDLEAAFLRYRAARGQPVRS